MELKRTKKSMVEIVSLLFHARTQLHIYHLQSLSYAQHKALNEAYDGIVDLIDSLVETYQGKTKAIIKGYKSMPFKEDDLPVPFLESLKKEVESYRMSIKEDFNMNNIDNQLQVIVDLIESTIYKLKFLK